MKRYTERMNILKTTAALPIFAAGLFFSAAALAQDDQTPRYEVADGWDVSVSLAAHYRPEYEGSDKNVLRALPQALAVYKDKYFAGTGAGIGFYTWYRPQTKGWLSIGYNWLGRDENDSEHLRGLGDIEGGATFIAGTSYLSPIGEFTLRVHNQFTGDDVGYYVFGGFQTKLDFTEQLFFSPAVDVYYASEDFMEAYFGVDAQQSLESGLPQYSAEAGLQSLGLRLRLVYLLDDHWQLQTAAVYHRMQGDSEDSPVTQDPNQYQAAIGVKYNF